MPLMQWLNSAPQQAQNPMLSQMPGFWNPPQAEPRWKSIIAAALAGAAGGAGGQNLGEGISRGFLTAQQLDDQRKQLDVQRQQQEMEQYGLMTEIADREAERERLANQGATLENLLSIPDTAMAEVPTLPQGGIGGPMGPLAAGAPPVGASPYGDAGMDDLAGIPTMPPAPPQNPPGQPQPSPLPPAGAPMEEVTAWIQQNMPPNVRTQAALASSTGGPEAGLKVISDWMGSLGETQDAKGLIKIGVVETPEGPAWQYGDPRTGAPVGPPVLVREESGGSSINFSPTMTMDAGLEPTTPVQTNLQEAILTGQTQIDNLQGMMALYEPEFLTYLGKGESAIANFLNKLDPENRSQFAQRAANFEQQTLQFFNAYRKWVTGVAAGEKEIGWLQDSIPSMGDSPQAFESKIQTMIQRGRIAMVRAQMALRQGITPDTEGWREWAAAHPLEGIPSANERGAQLEAQGYSEDQVLELLRQEGY